MIEAVAQSDQTKIGTLTSSLLGTALEHTQTGSTVEKVFHSPGVEDVQRDLTRASIQPDASRTRALQTTVCKPTIVRWS
jgi:hypothetical protein